MTTGRARPDVALSLKCGLGALALLACAGAGASSDRPDEVYVFASAPGAALARYQAGALGVVLPSYDRAYLYVAWRATALGAKQIRAAPNPPAGLLHALGSPNGGWRDIATGRRVYAAWRGAVAAALTLPADPPDNPVNTGDLNCPTASYEFATATLAGLSRRADATLARLADWIGSQQQVFRFCGDETASAGPQDSQRPETALAPLPASEALYWRQMHEYQMGAAAMYGGGDAEALFARIGATEGHPLRQWGEYLALRARVRGIVDASKNPGETVETTPADATKAMADIRAAGEHILRDPTLSALHEATRAAMRVAQARLAPDDRFDELNKLLDDPRNDPYREDRLGDWRALSGFYLKRWGDAPDASELALRKEHGFIDWIQTLRACAYPRQPGACDADRQHALDQWRRFAGAGAKGEAQARVWLLAAATLQDTLPPDVEKAALQVEADAPDYLSLRYRLARHYRLTGQYDKARAAGDAILKGAALAQAASAGTRNLFLRERFAVAAAPAEAANYLLRSIALEHDPDTGETAVTMTDGEGKPVAAAPDPALDGLRWLNNGLATGDLLALADHPGLPATLRANIAAAAWMRADLLDESGLALRAAGKVGKLAPALAAPMRQYAAAPDAAQRRHLMLLDALRFGLSATVESNRYQPATGPQRQDDSDILARRWCELGTRAAASDDQNWYDDVSNLGTLRGTTGVLPDTGNTAARDAEMAQLGKLKTSTGFIGDYALRRAVTTPNDPDLPWLLHVVVLSTKNGCMDDDHHALSKAAFTLLHKRYKNNPWTRATPYFY